jgi:anti-sigma regulatory factor (Ser/Thr protein kinase)
MLLDQRFDAGTLHVLRAAARELAAGAGMSPRRADDVMIAVHELAANAVRHGAGAGRLRMWTAARALCCQIDDAGPPGLPGQNRHAGNGGQQVAGTGGADGGIWPLQPGHGLWLTRELADQMNVTSGPGGSQVTVVFILHPR